MKTIYKYQLLLTDQQQVMMPEGSELLTVMMQGGVLCLWAEVDTEYPEIPCTVWVVGTGNPMAEECSDNCNHIGSVIDGPFVWHVFS